MPDARPLLVVAPNWLGDAVMALPAIRDLARHFSGEPLTIAARPGVSSLFAMVDGVSAVVKSDAAAVGGVHAAVAVLLPNSFASAWLVSRARVPERWGYATDMRRVLLTRAIPRPRQPMHQGEYYQHLVRELGVATGPLEPVLTIPATAAEDARRLLTQHGWDEKRPLVVLAPGAAYGKAKQWIPAHVVRLVTELIARYGVTCALIGSRGDAATTRAIRSAVPSQQRARVLDLAGATTLPVLAATLSLATVCISNDSGAMHLAGAVGAPVVAIFGPTNEQATSPLMRRDVPSALLTARVWCRPCMLRECPIDHRCMTMIEPEGVLDAAETLAHLEPI